MSETRVSVLRANIFPALYAFPTVNTCPTVQRMCDLLSQCTCVSIFCVWQCHKSSIMPCAQVSMLSYPTCKYLSNCDRTRAEEILLSKCASWARLTLEKQRQKMFLFQCLYEKSFVGCCNSIFQLTYSLKSDAPYCLNIPKLKSILMQFLYDQMHSILSAFAFAAFFVVLVFCHLYVFGFRGITHLSDSRSIFSCLLVWGTLRFH